MGKSNIAKYNPFFSKRIAKTKQDIEFAKNCFLERDSLYTLYDLYDEIMHITDDLKYELSDFEFLRPLYMIVNRFRVELNLFEDDDNYNEKITKIFDKYLCEIIMILHKVNEGPHKKERFEGVL